MSFSDYKNIAQVQQEFTIRYAEHNFLRDQPRNVSWFVYSKTIRTPKSNQSDASSPTVFST